MTFAKSEKVSITGGGTPKRQQRGGLHPPHTATARDGEDWLIRVVRVPISREIKPQGSTYRDFNVRDAVHDQVEAIKKRLGKRVLAGYMQLPTFTRDRALSIRADEGHCGAKIAATVFGE